MSHWDPTQKWPLSSEQCEKCGLQTREWNRVWGEELGPLDTSGTRAKTAPADKSTQTANKHGNQRFLLASREEACASLQTQPVCASQSRDLRMSSFHQSLSTILSVIMKHELCWWADTQTLRLIIIYIQADCCCQLYIQIAVFSNCQWRHNCKLQFSNSDEEKPETDQISTDNQQQIKRGLFLMTFQWY